MNDSARPQAPDTTEQAATETTAETSMARRRAVLRRMGSGAALAAAGSPLQVLATSGHKHCFHKDTPNKKVKATVSGMQSVISSNMAQDWPESKGKHCSYYKYTSNWPKDGNGKPYCAGRGGTRYSKSAKYRDVFGCAGGGANDYTIEYVMSNQIAPHCNWVTACLNATKLGSEFSYDPSEVAAMHNDSTKNMDALYFFKYYQENYYS